MLKGHVFSKQIFGNPIFALFINTFLNGQDGVSNNYKNGMKVTYSDSNINIESGAVCIQGRFLEEDTSKQIAVGADTAYCKLVIEINLDKENTESELNQASYKIIKSTSSYPSLTQTNIVKSNSGIYQYELARFRTSANGITDFRDMRNFLDFNSIYTYITNKFNQLNEEVQQEYKNTLEELSKLLNDVEDGSRYVLKDKFATLIVTDENMKYDTSHNQYYADLNYPNGFNNANCVILSVMEGGINMEMGRSDKTIWLWDDRIRCQDLYHNGGMTYKIVLMKI